jgi:YHS domain-containing protein
MIAAIGLSAGPTTLVLKGFDPVELLAGREVAGEAQYAAEFGRHEYRFVSQENLKRFQKEPLRYAVQNGGACGKMGALTGKGGAERFAVVNGRIFLFASDGCRSGFLAKPDPYFLPLPQPPQATEKERSAALDFYTRMIHAHGSHESIKRLKAISWKRERPYEADGKRHVSVSASALAGPAKFASWTKWHAGEGFFFRNGREAREGDANASFALHPGEERALTASFTRSVPGILMGLAEPRKMLGSNGVAMVRDDIVFEVYVNPETMRIVRVKYRDYYAGPVRDVEVEYLGFQEVAGIALPDFSRMRVDGGTWGEPSPGAKYEVSAPLPAWLR